jgi:isopentenyl-diphosphate Delta-isomerase
LSNLDEAVDVVDENDNAVDQRSLLDCVELGLLHRAILAILLDSSMERTFIQKRSEKKAFFPGLWSASTTGHVSTGESYLEGATREVKEELGLNDVRLKFLFKFLSPKWTFGSRTEWEYIGVFEGSTMDQTISLQSEEVQEGKYVFLDELAKLLESDEKSFTPDSVIAFRNYSRISSKKGTLNEK